MENGNRYAVPMASLESVEVPVDRQVAEQAVHLDREYLTPEELDRVRLLATCEAGRLRAR